MNENFNAFPFAVLGVYNEDEGPILVDFIEAPTINAAKADVTALYPDLRSFTLCYLGDSWSFQKQPIEYEWLRVTADEAGVGA